MSTNIETKQSNELPLEFQLFTLSFKEKGAITKFAEDLPPNLMGVIDNNSGLKEFYQALIDFYNVTGLDPIEPIAFRSWLETERETYDAINNLIGMDAFMETILDLEGSNPDAVVSVLKERANKRMQLDALQELQLLLMKKDHKEEADLDRITKLTERIRELEHQVDYNPFSTVISSSDIVAGLDDIFQIPDFLPTQFKAINRAMAYTDLGGYFRGAVHAIVAESGKGKSTFAKSLMYNWLDEGYNCLYINYEEAQNHWDKILLSQILKQNVYRHADSWTKEEEEENKKIATEKLLSWGDRLQVQHSPDSSLYDDLERWLRDILGHNDWVPDVVIIDTIQSLIRKGGGPRWGDYEMMMIGLERLAKDMNAVFIITAQQNNEATRDNRDVVKKSDVGGSLTIVQKCSVISVITEKKLAIQDETIDDSIMQVQFIKNRITGSSMSNQPAVIRYDDESKLYVEYDDLDEDKYQEGIIPKELLFGYEDLD